MITIADARRTFEGDEAILFRILSRLVQKRWLRCRFVHTAPERFFGLNTTVIDDEPVVITDIHRTVIDCLNRPDLCGGVIEAAKAVYYYAQRQDSSPQRLNEVGARLGNRTVFKRLGYLVQLLAIEDASPSAGWRDSLAVWGSQLSAGFARLDPRLPKQGTLDHRWRLQINVPPELSIEFFTMP